MFEVGEGFSYSKNCGWIDWGHTNPGHPRKLIAYVREASQRLERKKKKDPNAHEDFYAPPMEGKKIITFEYLNLKISLLRPLSEDEVIRVSLGIFLAQSVLFEDVQKRLDFLHSSSFSEEDLPSNLISFYRASHGYSKEEVESLCKSYSQSESMDVYTGWDKIKKPSDILSWEFYKWEKNKQLEPKALPEGGSWPREFSSVKPLFNGDVWKILEVIKEKK